MKATRHESVGASRRGFTLIEAIVVIVILGILATVVAPRVLKNIGSSKQSVTKQRAAAAATGVRNFMADHGEPEDGATIDLLWEAPSNITDDTWDPYVEKAEDLLDAWGNKLILIVPGKVNRSFDIVSYGRDGKPGGDGEDADIVVP